MSANTPPPRRRRSPEESRREILDAAAAALREHSVAELTVGTLMAHARLGRSSFYVHFDDIEDLVAALLKDLEGELWAGADRWVSATADSRGRDELRQAVGEVVSVWVEHGPVLRAIVESALSNPAIHALWREQLLERFIDGVSQGIQSLGTQGTGAPPRELATALLLMNERYLADRLGHLPQHDPQEVTDTLADIWVRAIYP